MRFNTLFYAFRLYEVTFVRTIKTTRGPLKRLFKILRYTVASLLSLVLAVVVMVNLTPVQNIIARKGADMLSKKLKTKVSIDHIRLDFFSHILLQGLYVEDQSHDTLLYAGEAQVRINDFIFTKNKPVLHYFGLKNTYVHLYRTALANSWNSDFIADAFSTKASPEDTISKKPFELDLKKIELENIRFHMDDKWIGQDLDFDIGGFVINTKGLDINKKFIDVDNIEIKNAVVYVGMYKAGKPKTKHTQEVYEFDTTPFNPDNWSAKVASLSLADCSFNLKMDDKIPVPNLFDENHLAIRDINVSVKDVGVVGDTIHGNVLHLSAHDRCGIAIKAMRSKVSISPVASICDDLYLETGYSKIQNYYAMHYKHFPDFTSYIDSVTMVGHLKDAVIDARDIAFFAPQLNKLPHVILHASGEGQGTVANLSAQHLNVSDGNTVVTGNITMKGLPDIYKTYITWSDGQLLTTGSGILRYVPDLKNSPNIALERLTYAYFNGKYEGYIENFAVNGALKTNLGTAALAVKMNIPGFNSSTAAYSGKIATNDLQLGILLKQPLLGGITLTENVTGNSFDPDRIQVDVDGTISALTLNGYNYQNILTQGKVAKKQFVGKLLVDDPNLALEFDGGIDYSKKDFNINATAHLLGSNFKALNLTTDTVTVSADFDLNCTGSNIDQFSGYAKLFNIDLKRNAHKVALDSVYVRSTGDSTKRLLTIQSNDLLASIKGSYQLSKLPASVQFYLSRYIPNYISAPTKFAPDQNLEFTINTGSIDSILAVTVPIMRGFDSSTISGSFNTTAQKLTLNASIPYGSIGTFHMNNISIQGQGNLDIIALNTNIDNVSVGDSALNGSLSLTASLGNDSVAFTIATTSPDTSSAITLKGQIIARKDSLFLTVLPSQFYLNQAKWDIAGGSKVVYSNKYLDVQGITLTSGLQRITAATQFQNSDRAILINTENLDLGQLGNWAGLAAYQPDGRLNGTIRIDRIFDNMFISANIHATDVKLGADTVGIVTIIGDYDGVKKLLRLDPQTGIFHGNASAIAQGNISFDSTTHQKLDGSIQFYNAPVVWASPFLSGLMSHLSGTLNGNVAFNGSSYAPEMNGSVNLLNAGVKLDYTGCTYTIPAATVTINNRRINFGTIELFDAYNNRATLKGHFSHNLFKNMRMHLTLSSEKFEVLKLTSNDNNIFYGNIVAGMDSFTVRGPFTDIRMEAFNAYPSADSRIFIPISSGSSDISGYSYASFKTYGKTQEKIVHRIKNKLSIKIDANINPMAEMHIVLDPSTGDEIMARGNGRIQLDIPPSNDMRITGQYVIDDGTYTYTYKKLLLTRQFRLEPNGAISFNGPFSSTSVNVDALYSTKARLYDMLTEQQKGLIPAGTELIDAQTPQVVNVILHMKGPLTKPNLTFDIDLAENHSQGTLAYRQLTLLNNDPQQQTTEVGALLLFSAFVSPENLGGAVTTGAINNINQILSSTTSTGLTNLIAKVTGDKQLNVAVRYSNYNYEQSAAAGSTTRSQASVDVSRNFFNNRLIVEGGSTSDWGKPANASSSTNFNITGDFRIQYQVRENSGVRINAFRTSDYDVTLDRNIVRSGFGVSWRKSFDNFNEFFRGNKYAAKQKEEQLLKAKQDASDSIQSNMKKTSGTD